MSEMCKISIYTISILRSLKACLKLFQLQHSINVPQGFKWQIQCGLNLFMADFAYHNDHSSTMQMHFHVQ